MRPMMIGKIHRATITGADLHYVGSLTVDADLLDAANLPPGHQVDVVDITNGARLTTYVIPGERGSGVLTINGAAAHHIQAGDLVIVIAYGHLSDEDARSYEPSVVFVDEDNRIVECSHEPGQVPDTDRGSAPEMESSGETFASYRAAKARHTLPKG
ncbi:aspartate 1-decarboxylase [Georgenia sp. Z1344]|uniref:aspartate 1-decarboxylase n=1 Tax=Georgenia sp. Z1344 TaxID=3416706 RepID=UPI003CE72C2E